MCCSMVTRNSVSCANQLLDGRTIQEDLIYTKPYALLCSLNFISTYFWLTERNFLPWPLNGFHWVTRI